MPETRDAKRFGPYVIQGEIARGGQGAVMKALGPDGRICALKMLTDRDPQALARFQQEAKVLAALSHPNLLRVTDLGRQNEIPYLAMEFVDGQDLEAHVAERGVPAFEWTGRTLGAVAHALHTCHLQGLIHRDLKPANVLVEDGSERPVLVDFGLVKRDPERMRISMEQAPRSRTGEIKGTPKFMAPEQASPARQHEISPLSDVYALGACLFFLLTGLPPFNGASLVIVLSKVIGDPAPDPRSLNPAVPAPLAAFCLRCLSKAISERPQSAEAFARELAALTGQTPWLPRFPQPTAPKPLPGQPLSARDPRELGPYALRRLLGKGGMGAVFLGQHRTLGVTRAIKVLATSGGGKRSQRFQREIAHLASIRHPNVVSIHDSGQHESWVWFAMDLIDGVSLDEWILQESPVPNERAAQVAFGIAQGLGALHRRGIVHRDLKPQNVVLRSDGRPVVIDLGLAIAPELDGRLTKTGAVLGTPLYMAPEQISGGTPDARVDVYTAGLLLYELLTGEQAVEPAPIEQVLASVLYEPLSPPSAHTPSVSTALDRVCLDACTKDPDGRPRDGDALAERLAPLCGSNGEVTRASGVSSKALVVLGAVLVALGVGAGVAITSRERRPPHAAPAGSPEPTTAAETPPRRTLSDRELKSGERELRRVRRLSTAQARADAFERWLTDYADHPKRGEVLAALREAKTSFPAFSLKGVRGCFVGPRLVATRESNRPDVFRLYDIEAHETPRAEIPVPFHIWGLAGSPDGAAIFIGGGKPGAVLRITPEGKVAAEFPFPGLHVSRVAVSPDSQTLVVATQPDDGQDYTLRFLDPRSGFQQRTLALPMPGVLYALEFSPDGTRLVTAGGTTVMNNYGEDPERVGSAMFVHDPRSGELIRRVRFTARPSFVSFAPDSTVFVTGTNGGRLVLFDAADGALVHEFLSEDEQVKREALGMLQTALADAVRGAAFSPDGQTIYVASGEVDVGRGSYTMWDRRSGKRTRLIPLDPLYDLSLSPDGALLTMGCNRERVDVWRAP